MSAFDKLRENLQQALGSLMATNPQLEDASKKFRMGAQLPYFAQLPDEVRLPVVGALIAGAEAMEQMMDVHRTIFAAFEGVDVAIEAMAKVEADVDEMKRRLDQGEDWKGEGVE